MNNDQGTLRSDGTLDMRAASLSNNTGSVTSASTASVSTSGAVVNRGGQILSDSTARRQSARAVRWSTAAGRS
ncbi:hypothetical protein AO068_26200 [Pseudomonas sp. ICMP 3272]|nr:hypothetical protein AO068_26200 [Pseudomonas sp. ICMP 3272]